MPFSGQPGNVAEITGLDSVDEFPLSAAVLPTGEVIFMYADRIGASSNYEIYYMIYNPTTGSWGSPVLIEPSGSPTRTVGDAVYRQGTCVVNRDGYTAFFIPTGTTAGGAEDFIVRIRKPDGTMQARISIIDAKDLSYMSGAAVVRDCRNFAFITNDDSLAYANATIFEIDYFYNSLAKRTVVWDSRDWPNHTIYFHTKRSVCYDPVNDVVHAVLNVHRDGGGQNDPYELVHLSEGATPTYASIPSNVKGSVSYSPVHPRVVCDNVDGGRLYVVYRSKPVLGDDGTEEIMFREWSDRGGWGPEFSVYGPEATGNVFHRDIQIDGNGNIHLLYARNRQVIIPSVQFKYSANSGSCGYAYQRLVRGANVMDQPQEVFYTQSPDNIFDNDEAFFAQIRPSSDVLYAISNRHDSSGASTGPGDRIVMNWTDDVLGSTLSDDGTLVLSECLGVDPTSNDVAHRQFLFDERSFSPLQDDVGVQ